LIRSECGICKEINVKNRVILRCQRGANALWALLREVERFYGAGVGRGWRPRERIERSGIDAKEFDHAVFGNAQQTSGDAAVWGAACGIAGGTAD